MAYGASLENWFPPGTMGSNPIPCAIHHIPCVHESYLDFLTEERENKLITAKNKQIIINALRKRVSSLWDSSEDSLPSRSNPVFLQFVLPFLAFL